MKFLEKDLEQIIWEADKMLLCTRGLDLDGRLFRQFKIGNYGIADLVEIKRKHDAPDSSYLDINIIELKQDKIGISAFLQAVRYSKGIHDYLTNKRDFENFKLSITLIGSEIDMSGSFIYLTDLISDSDNYGILHCLDFYTYNYDFDGIQFNRIHGYKLIENGF